MKYLAVRKRIVLADAKAISPTTLDAATLSMAKRIASMYAISKDNLLGFQALVGAVAFLLRNPAYQAKSRELLDSIRRSEDAFRDLANSLNLTPFGVQQRKEETSLRRIKCLPPISRS